MFITGLGQLLWLAVLVVLVASVLLSVLFLLVKHTKLGMFTHHQVAYSKPWLAKPSPAFSDQEWQDLAKKPTVGRPTGWDSTAHKMHQAAMKQVVLPKPAIQTGPTGSTGPTGPTGSNGANHANLVAVMASWCGFCQKAHAAHQQVDSAGQHIQEVYCDKTPNHPACQNHASQAKQGYPAYYKNNQQVQYGFTPNVGQLIEQHAK